MKLSSIIFALCVLFLTSCSSTKYYKRGATVTDLKRDLYVADLQVDREFNNCSEPQTTSIFEGVGRGIAFASMRDTRRQAYMKEMGWTVIEDDEPQSHKNIARKTRKNKTIEGMNSKK